MPDTRSFHITETPAIPPISLLLGFGAMIPIAVGTILAWVLADPARAALRAATLIWSSAILLFLSGVRRGISFRTQSGPTLGQLATMLWLFVLGLATLPLIPTPAAPALLVVGYLSIAVLDPIAARNGTAPLFFARLRPVQMAIPVVCLLSLTFIPHG